MSIYPGYGHDKTTHVTTTTVQLSGTNNNSYLGNKASRLRIQKAQEARLNSNDFDIGEIQLNKSNVAAFQKVESKNVEIVKNGVKVINGQTKWKSTPPSDGFKTLPARQNTKEKIEPPKLINPKELSKQPSGYQTIPAKKKFEKVATPTDTPKNPLWKTQQNGVASPVANNPWKTSQNSTENASSSPESRTNPWKTSRNSKEKSETAKTNGTSENRTNSPPWKSQNSNEKLENTNGAGQASRPRTPPWKASQNSKESALSTSTKSPTRKTPQENGFNTTTPSPRTPQSGQNKAPNSPKNSPKSARNGEVVEEEQVNMKAIIARFEPNEEKVKTGNTLFKRSSFVAPKLTRQDAEDQKEVIEVKKKSVEDLSIDTTGTKEKKLKPLNRYRTIEKMIPPIVDVSLTPWTPTRKLITDLESEEYKMVEAERRKTIDLEAAESLEVKEETQSNGEVTEGRADIVMRPISVESYEGTRGSSGASLDVDFPKALDLVRHQQRVLWQDIRGIKEMCQPETMPKQQRIRQEAKFELMFSEASFLHSLQILEGHYMKNIKKHIPHVIGEKDYDLLFKHAVELKKASQAFLEDLDEVWQRDPMLNGIYEVIRTHTSEHFQAYVKYCRNMLDMGNHLTTLIANNSAFKDLLEVLVNREGSHRLTLNAFLTAPMQRITKLPLLMKTILDKLEEGTDEHAQCVAAYEASSKIAMECDEVVEEKRKLESLLLVSKELEFAEDTKSIPIVAPHRTLVSRANVRHFAFGDKTTKKEKLQLILFNDLMLVTKRKSDKLYTVVDYCYREKMFLKEMESPSLYGQGENPKQQKPVVITMLYNSHDRKLELVVIFKDPKVCKEWKELLGRAEEEADNIVQYIASESYIANAADELSFIAGEIIEAAGPEVDGWCLGELLNDGSKGRFTLDKVQRVSTVAKSAKKAKKERMSRNMDDTVSLKTENSQETCENSKVETESKCEEQETKDEPETKEEQKIKEEQETVEETKEEEDKIEEMSMDESASVEESKTLEV